MTRHAFPADLARAVADKWTAPVVGSFRRPPLPNPDQLRALLEVAYLAGQETDEGRSLAFTLCCTPEAENVRRHDRDELIESWTVAAPRAFDVQEVRRLAVTADLDTMAIWVTYTGDRLTVKGLLNVGASWAQARQGFAFHYDSLPFAVTVRADGPGKLTVYQGPVALASLAGGQLHHTGFAAGSMHGLRPLFDDGHRYFEDLIENPVHAPVAMARDFEWTAYTTTLLAIVNAIRQRGHGGALILAGAASPLAQPQQRLVKLKYELAGAHAHLADRYVRLMSLRNALADLQWRSELDPHAIEPLPPDLNGLRLAYFEVRDANQQLAETCACVGHLAGTDGAVVLRTDLSVLGFGAEILLEQMPAAPVYEVSGTSLASRTLLDSEQFGMRHRSAMRLCAAVSDAAVFVISQDGGVGLVFSNAGRVCFRRDINTTSASMPYS
ncbi:MAG: hypothetical protein JWM80_1997 [Cyanobacteria bacterium RYN_339]|nr:hypothetical protein [Cyanobacteria bacterium RYN_339]